MQRYAFISNGKVLNVVESATAPDGWTACGDAGPGWTYDAGVFSPPPQVAAPTAPRHISGLSFISRFTDAEAIALDLASIGATVQAATIRRYMNKVNRAEFIDLDRADTRGGVQALEAATLIAPGRAIEILDAPIGALEAYSR